VTLVQSVRNAKLQKKRATALPQPLVYILEGNCVSNEGDQDVKKLISIVAMQMSDSNPMIVHKDKVINDGDDTCILNKCISVSS